MRICFFPSPLLPAHRLNIRTWILLEVDGNGRSLSFCALDLYLPAMGLDNVPDNMKAQTRSLADFLGGEKRVENPADVLLGYSLPRIGDADFHIFPVGWGDEKTFIQPTSIDPIFVPHCL